MALILLLCCIGGFFVLRGADDESPPPTTTSQPATETSTSEPTSETSTSEPTTETSTSEPTSETSSSTSAAGTGDFPDEFDGWKKSSKVGNLKSVATYTKGTEAVSVLANEGISASTFENVWDDSQKVGDISCGTVSGSTSTQCAVDKDGTTYLMSSSGKKSAKDLAATLTKFTDAL
ncbi:hypothetical protein ASG73_02950 [Janibacter sp. Soil728]|nr:hypothetical protein ASG73_02950 [Janibacter sp. Soil728]